MRTWLLAFVVLTIVGHAQERKGDDGATRADWPHYGGSVRSWRYSALDQISTSNVKGLVPAWMFQTGDYGNGLLSTPIVIDGVMYISTPRSQVFAVDAASGRVRWSYKHAMRQTSGPPTGMTAYVQNRGVAVGDGKVFVGTTDSFLIAIDQLTGREVWKVAVDDSRQCGCTIPSAPLVVKDKVIVGQSGGDLAHRGHLTAFSTKTGRFAWRFYVIPAPGEPGNETWKGDSWKVGGGAPWMTGSYDPDLNLVYWGTGNAASDLFDGNRRVANNNSALGSNLYTGSVVALDADTGKLRWHHQEVPGDVWDFDSAYETLLIDREVRGRPRKLLMHMNKSGLTFVLDRETGEYVSAFSVAENQTWIDGLGDRGELVGRKDPAVGKTINVCPSPIGAKSWNQMAYSPRTGLIYTPTLEICADLTARAQDPVEGRAYIGGNWVFKLPPNRDTYSHLDAVDPMTGKRVWSMPYRYVLMASVLATAGDLVFTGDPEGNFFALDAMTGSKLWTFQTGAGHRGSAIAYAVNGREFIATPTGWGSIAANTSALFPDVRDTWRGGSALVAFALPEGSK